MVNDAKFKGCGHPLTRADDSEAHVIPNALGGRLSPRGILCRKCNAILDREADNPLIRAFGPWPTLLNLPRDRGNQPAAVLETRKGRRAKVTPDGSSAYADTTYSVRQTDAGTEISISAGKWRTVDELLARAKKEVPALDPALVRGLAKVARADDDEFRVTLDFSPRATFGGVVAAVWLFLVARTGSGTMGWDRLISCIRSVRQNGGAFRYMPGGLPGLRGPDIPLGHKIVVRSVPATGQMIAYVEVLGVLRVGGVYAAATAPAPAIEQLYVYDLVQGADRTAEFSIDARDFDARDWAAEGVPPTVSKAGEWAPYFRWALESLGARYRERPFCGPS